MPTSAGTKNPPGKSSRQGVGVWGRCKRYKKVV